MPFILYLFHNMPDNFNKKAANFNTTFKCQHSKNSIGVTSQRACYSHYTHQEYDTEFYLLHMCKHDTHFQSGLLNLLACNTGKSIIN